MSSELGILEVDSTELAEAGEFSMGVLRLTVPLEGQEHEVFALYDGTATPVVPVAHLYSWTRGLSSTPPPVARKKVKKATILPTTVPSVSGVALVLKGVQLSTVLPTVTLYRYIRGTVDHKYQSASGQLQPGTYLTTALDHDYANSGLAAVGRYALPSAFPPDNMFSYVLAGMTLVDVGTVLPNFGEAGGGVEVQLTMATSATPGTAPSQLPQF